MNWIGLDWPGFGQSINKSVIHLRNDRNDQLIKTVIVKRLTSKVTGGGNHPEEEEAEEAEEARVTWGNDWSS